MFSKFAVMYARLSTRIFKHSRQIISNRQYLKLKTCINSASSRCVPYDAVEKNLIISIIKGYLARLARFLLLIAVYWDWAFALLLFQQFCLLPYTVKKKMLSSRLVRLKVSRESCSKRKYDIGPIPSKSALQLKIWC